MFLSIYRCVNDSFAKMNTTYSRLLVKLYRLQTIKCVVPLHALYFQSCIKLNHCTSYKTCCASGCM